MLILEKKTKIFNHCIKFPSSEVRKRKIKNNQKGENSEDKSRKERGKGQTIDKINKAKG